MAKLIDQPGVAELTAKHAASAVKAYVKSAVASVKAVTAEHLDFHVDNKAGAKAVKDHSKAVVAALKEPIT